MGALLILRSMNINFSEQFSSPAFQAMRTEFSPGWSYSTPLISTSNNPGGVSCQFR